MPTSFIVTNMLKNKFIITVLVVFSVLVHGASDGTDEVSVIEGDSVTLHTNITRNQQDRIKWYFHDMRIAFIYGDRFNICSDVQCYEIFRDRLKVDSHTGDLTITNTRKTDSGVYHLKFNSSGKIFNIAVHDVPAAELEVKRKSVKEGESVTLETPIVKNPNNLLMWYFNDTLIASGDQSKICTDVHCDERFRDRLKLDPFGSLTITNTRTTDSGEYTLKIISSRFSITRIKSFNVTVTGSDLSPGVIAGIVVGGVLVLVSVAAAAGVTYYCCTRSRNGDMKKSKKNILLTVMEKTEEYQDLKDQSEDVE